MKSRRWWLAAAAGFGVFASGAWAFAPATWLSVFFAQRYVRSRPTGRGYLELSAVMVPVVALSWHDFPFGGIAGLAVVSIAGAFIGNLPYVADRVLAPERGWLRTLLLPATAAAFEWLNSMGDLGSWGAAGYSLLGTPPFAQLASLAGLGGLTFVIAWTAAVANEAAEALDRDERPHPHLAVVGVTIAATVAYGAWRLVDSPVETVRVATVATPSLDVFGDDDLGSRWRAGEKLDATDIAHLSAHHAPRLAALAAQTRAAASDDARLVVWSEGAAVTTDETALTAELADLARQSGVYLVAAVLVLPVDGSAKWDNLAVLFTPAGEVAWRYRKAVPTPGAESAVSLRGDGKMLAHDAPFGRIGAVICYDADFPQLVAQTAHLGVDILAVPAGDWPEIAEAHADMSRMRAIEQGIAVVRPAAAGLSAVIDPRGRVVGSQLQQGDELATVVADVPIDETTTPYGRLGNVVAGLCAGALLVLGVARWSRGRRRRDGVD